MEIPAGWTPQDYDVVRHARVLPLDIVQANGSGHAGTAVSLTPFLYVLFQEYLRHDPTDPAWPGRDRFVLSCGHTSLSLYIQLFLSGYGLEMADLRAVRKLDSLTPGHPEYGVTPGVETSTGPLGQGLGNAVGMAMAARRITGMFEAEHTAHAKLFEHRVFCVVSDGDLAEGVSHEAASLAGHLALDNIVVIWDDNRISIDGATNVATSEDVCARMRAYGWSVFEIEDAESVDSIRAALDDATAETGAPAFIRLRTRIGNPMPVIGGTASAHAGAPGSDEIRATKSILGLDPATDFAMPAELLTHSRRVSERGRAEHESWNGALEKWANANPAQRELMKRVQAGILPDDWQNRLPSFAPGTTVATRIASKQVLTELAHALPEVWGGSADLTESNGTLIDGLSSMLRPGTVNDEWPGDAFGRLIHFGIREHAMGAILNGIALAGMTRVFGATYFVFSDYMRPAVRLAALMKLAVTYVWTHDSLAVGEDGPTHQPVEQLWANRSIPGLSVIRPADGNETSAAWRRIIESNAGPHALCLSRQALPTLEPTDRVLSLTSRGGYVLTDDDGAPDALIIATGSEVQLAVAAQKQLADEHINARVVSMPCLEWFEQQPAEYRDEVLPPTVNARVSVEAGLALGWYKYLGSHGEAVSVEEFGESGPAPALLERRGITVDAVVGAVRRSLERADSRLSPVM